MSTTDDIERKIKSRLVDTYGCDAPQVEYIWTMWSSLAYRLYAQDMPIGAIAGQLIDNYLSSGGEYAPNKARKRNADSQNTET